MDDRNHTAIHEAGHAVIWRVLGLACGDVTIEPDHESAGHSVAEEPYGILQAWDDRGVHHRDLDVAYRARFIVYMAGREAEKAYLGASGGGDGDDGQQIDLMLDSLLPVDADFPRYAMRLRSMTRGLVRRHRLTIERVAAELLAGGHLSAVDVGRMM